MWLLAPETLPRPSQQQRDAKAHENWHRVQSHRLHAHPRLLARIIAKHLSFRSASEAEAWSYNVLQQLTYLFVIFVLFPLVIWTGLAMSPAIASAFPAAVTVLGGQQSARTIHFFVSVFLLLFLLVHVGMVSLTGFRNRMRAMITGRPATNMEPR